MKSFILILGFLGAVLLNYNQASTKKRALSGKTYVSPVISLDILPTVVMATGAESPQDIDGVNLLPYIKGEKSGQQPEWELYNLAEDLGENNNLIKKIPEKFNELFPKWKELNGKMMDPLFK